MVTAERLTVDFWFDPACPYSWLTSRWVAEVARLRPIDVNWRVMSLSVLNEGRDDDPEGDPEGYLWVPVRVCVAARIGYGNAALGRLYEALWTTSGGDDWIGDLHVALDQAGLPRSLADAGTTTDYDEAVRASHAEGIGLVGDHVGTPVVAVSDGAGRRTAFFGPVISTVPTGEDAERLWDGTLLVAGVPGFHELKTTPPADPDLAGAAGRAVS